MKWPILEERVRGCLRLEHSAYRTEQTSVAWIRRYVAFQGWRKRSRLEAEAVRDFLRHLAVDMQVASSTQNQALNAGESPRHGPAPPAWQGGSVIRRPIEARADSGPADIRPGPLEGESCSGRTPASVSRHPPDTRSRGSRRLGGSLALHAPDAKYVGARRREPTAQ